MRRRNFLGLLGGTALTQVLPDPVHPELREMTHEDRITMAQRWTDALVRSMLETKENAAADVLNGWRVIEHDGKDVQWRWISDEAMRA
jgi:hypothetical protein